jgi:hypothetical protein
LHSYQQYIQAALRLLEEEPLILASLEDATFFRQAIQNPVKIEKAPVEIKPVVLNEIKIAPILQNLNPIAVPLPPPPQPDPIMPLEPIVLKTKSYASFFTLFSKIAPEMALLKEIPDDLIAKKMAQRWKTKNQIAPITLLSFLEPEPHQKLLKELIKALDVYFGPAKIVQAEKIEKEKQWETFLSSEELKLIIVCDYTLWQLNHLMPFYKEVPNVGARTLGKVPLFLLPDLSLYLKDPLLKRSLWKGLQCIL